MKISKNVTFWITGILVLMLCMIFLQRYFNTVAKGFKQKYIAELYGFSPSASGVENRKALQRAIDCMGTIIVNKPGVYKVAGTLFIGSNTSLIFGNNVFLKKVNEVGDFSHVIVNKGAKVRKFDQNIEIRGLQIIINEIDVNKFEVVNGLRGQLAFFYVKDLKIDRFRCLDVGKNQYCIQVCTFENISINNLIIKGLKDGVHLGRGKRFKISNAMFETRDDAIALNAHDYATGNPELGWIEDGIIDNCLDMNGPKSAGYFCRILAGSWLDWKPGLELQQSDAVISNGRLYRVFTKPDGSIYKTFTKPTHQQGIQVLDGISWAMVQIGNTYTAGVKNVVFRDIHLEKPRTGFSIHFDNDRFSRSYYPGANIPKQERLTFDQINVLYKDPTTLIDINTPISNITIINSNLRNNRIKFYGGSLLKDYLKTEVNIYSSTYIHRGKMVILENTVDGKEIDLKTSGNINSHDTFSAKILPANGIIRVNSDFNGLSKIGKKVFQ